MESEKLYHNNVSEEELASIINVFSALVGVEVLDKIADKSPEQLKEGKGNKQIEARKEEDGSFSLAAIIDEESKNTIYTARLKVQEANGNAFINGMLDYDDGDGLYRERHTFQVVDATETKSDQSLLAVIKDEQLHGFIAYPYTESFNGLVPGEATICKPDGAPIKNESVTACEAIHVEKAAYLKKLLRED